jgi:cytochrome c oxidase assembly protein subunit 15
VATVVARARLLSAVGFLRLAVASALALCLVITSGAFVRLTGSGLGCENWPRCGDKPYPEQGFHAFVEFGNRMVALVGVVLTLATWIGSRRTDGLSATGRRTALATFLVVVAQIPLGAITIAVDLHPLAVMMHFLLGLTALALAIVVALEGLLLVDGRAEPVEPAWFRKVVGLVGVPACLALVVTGAVATASGPHPGADEAVERLGIAITDTVYVHVRVAAAFGIGVLLVGWFLGRQRDRYPGVFVLWALLLGVLVAQAILGEVQYRNALPWGLVLVHVALAAAIWGLSIVIAYVVWRPPRRLARQ